MLKLEKTRNRNVNVTMRSRESLFSGAFLYAFGVAVGLHLLAAIVFQIHAYFGENEKILGPIFVESDSSNLYEHNDGILALVGDNDLSKRYSMAPGLSEPSIPKWPLNPCPLQMEYSKELSVDHNLFTVIEEDWQYLLTDNVERSAPPVKVNVSGELASFCIINEGMQNIQPRLNSVRDDFKKDSKYRGSFLVQVDGKTGQIFWQAVKESMKDDFLQDLAENILKDMVFKKNEKIFVAVGEVEIVFSL